MHCDFVMQRETSRQSSLIILCIYMYKYSVAVCKPQAMYINASRIYFPDVMRRFSISASIERKLALASNAKTGNENWHDRQSTLRSKKSCKTRSSLHHIQGDDDDSHVDDHDAGQFDASDDDYDYHNDHAGELTASATLNE